MVFPHEQTLHQFVLDENGCYQLKALHVEQVSSHLFPELLLDLNEVFESVGDD